MGLCSRSARAVLGCLLAVVVTAPAIGVRQATAADLATLQQRAKEVAADVTTSELRIADLEADERRLQKELRGIDHALARIEARRTAADAEAEAALEVYVQHAVAAYKMDDPTQFALVLNAGSLDEMYEVAQVTSRLAGEASRSVDRLSAAKARLAAAEGELEEEKARLLAATERVEKIAQEIRGTLAKRKEQLTSFRTDIKKLIADAETAAASVAAHSSIPVGQALLDILKGSGPSDGIPPGFVGTGVTLEGTASWYGPGFEGNNTASGDVFDPNLYTVASKELPLRSWLYVEHEGRGVVVYVNDRGPYVGDRILDLSRAAAEAIGISGLGWVEAEVVVKVDD